ACPFVTESPALTASATIPADGVKREGCRAATILPSAEVSRTRVPRVTSPIRTCDAATERSARVQRRIVGTARRRRRSPAPAAMSAIHAPRERPRGFAIALSITETFSIIEGSQEQRADHAGGARDLRISSKIEKFPPPEAGQVSGLAGHSSAGERAGN